MLRSLLVLTLVAGLLTSCGFRKKKYENPITKDTKQPDKVLFDKAINDIERGRYEVARITLNTMINTYDQSEFLAKAKLAIADSWYREGGAHGLAQAEAEYKDFILFYPTMEEAAESQEKICMIHYKQMDKADRDPTQAVRAEDECRTLVTQFPNSKFVPEAQQILRNIQEALAEGEFRVGAFYHKKGSNPAAANRFGRVVDQYPLYSKADLALWELGDSYSKMGNRFRSQAGQAYSRIVKDYPLSSYAEAAKNRLNELELPVPQADRAAYDRQKYELEHREKPGMVAKNMQLLKRGPDVSAAAKSGAPTMTSLRPTVPVSVPVPAGAAAGPGGVMVGDIAAKVEDGANQAQTKPDARMNQPTAPAATPAAGTETTKPATPVVPGATTTANQDPLPTNYQGKGKPKKKSKKQLKQEAEAAAKAAAAAPAATKPQ
jgi:outer membrane protein assembly factor BamD